MLSLSYSGVYRFPTLFHDLIHRNLGHFLDKRPYWSITLVAFYQLDLVSKKQQLLLYRLVDKTFVCQRVGNIF